MSEGKDQVIDTIAALEEQIRRLEQVAPFSMDPCLIAKLLAVKDSTVRQKLEERLRNPLVYEPKGVECLEPDLLFNQRVLFRFVCRPPVICLVDPSFLAIVNIPSRRVEVQDPYIPTTYASQLCHECAETVRVTPIRSRTQGGGPIQTRDTRTLDLGTQYWKEFRDHLTRPCRNCHANWYCDLSHPSIGDIWGDVVDCLKVAAVVAAITALLSGVGSAVAFEGALKICLISKGIEWANDIGMHTYRGPKDCGDWSAGACID